MNFTATREELLAALKLIGKVVPKRHQIPILSHVHLQADDGLLFVTGTDMDIQVRYTCGAEVSEAGVVVLPLAALNDFVRSAPKKAVLAFGLGSKDGQVTIDAGHRVATLNSLPASDFPQIAADGEGLKEAAKFCMPCVTLRDMLRQCCHAISTEETRYYLNGVFIEAKDGRLCATATDGHRMVHTTVDLPSGAEALPKDVAGNHGFILPRLAVGTAIAMLDGCRSKVRVSVIEGGTRVRLALGVQAEILTRLIDGTFPDYTRVIPSPSAHVLTSDAAYIAAAVKAASSVSKELSKSVKFDMSAEGVELSTNDPENGRGEARLNGSTTYTGEPLQIGFQARYLQGFCATVEGPLTITMDGNTGPALLTSPTLPNWRGVLMPVQV